MNTNDDWKEPVDEFNRIKDRLTSSTGSPGLTSYHSGKVLMTLQEWDRLVTLIEKTEADPAHVGAETLREAGRVFAEGEWLDAFLIGNVADDVSAALATDAWLNRRADDLARDT
ncbi:MAG: hypothetical protein L0H93_02475 [Nocardioides sp.]|nr:hypothetical protein [Nocardioides sp.]